MIKIFLSVGTQLPFDRLVKAVDLSLPNLTDITIFGQIGESAYLPINFEYTRYLDKLEYDRIFNNSDIVIAHAGMGSIITALQSHKPILIMPREVIYNEHRNDHQSHTFKKFCSLDGVYGFTNQEELMVHLKLASQLTAGKISDENILFANNILTLISKL